ncbi:SDR family NAD(P)-dependent oxidoreductase [Microbaculum marinum]|uniref:SDR family NAD(P)-dependent oxidoreductase n=1 Tax=Microbaculum marinum TaxID=1764581 RepID=A0AAW9RM26_9HYPH
MELGKDIAAVVTGGASGLGEATARMLAEAGCKVAILDMNASRGASVAGEIGATYCECDVTDPGSIDDALSAARSANGQERVTVNCAGIAIGMKTAGRKRDSGAIVAHNPGAFQKVIAVNLLGTFNVASKSAAGMLEASPIGKDGERGVIVMTSSVAAQDGQIGQLAYAASKGGVLSMTLPMARDLAKDGIRAMTIMPGLFYTPMFDSLSEDVRQSLADSVPFPQRLGDPGEYALLVRSICENRMLNGTGIRLDGALRMGPK